MFTIWQIISGNDGKETYFATFKDYLQTLHASDNVTFMHNGTRYNLQDDNALDKLSDALLANDNTILLAIVNFDTRCSVINQIKHITVLGNASITVEVQ